MKAMHYDFENVGGLLQVIAVPPASFVQIRKDYAAGLNYLELRNREDIVSIPVYANDTYSYNEDPLLSAGETILDRLNDEYFVDQPQKDERHAS